MEKEEYKLLNEVQHRHWVWFARRNIIKMMIEHEVNPTKRLAIADMGAGYGANLELLMKYGNVSAFEMNDDALQVIKSKLGGEVQTIKWQCPDKFDGKFDFILLADVLEHIPNEKQMVDWIYDHLNPGGHVMITVPAYRWLWTQMDDFLHHVRRYTKKTLEASFKDRFETKRLSYYHFILFPTKLLFVLFDHIERFLFSENPKKSYNRILPFGINRLFAMISRGEAELLKYISFPTGPSLFFLAKKK